MLVKLLQLLPSLAFSNPLSFVSVTLNLALIAECLQKKSRHRILVFLCLCPNRIVNRETVLLLDNNCQKMKRETSRYPMQM